MTEEIVILAISALALYSLSKAAFEQSHKRILLSLFGILALRSALAILAIRLSCYHHQISAVLVADYGVRLLDGVAIGLFLAFWITGGWTTIWSSLRKSPASHDQT